MNDQQLNLGKFVLDCLQLALLVGSAIWAYFRFIKERVHKPHIEFGIAGTFFGPELGPEQQNVYLAEFILSLTNRGVVLHEVSSLTLRVRGVRSKNPLTYWEGHGLRANFPDKILDDVEVIPKDSFIFVEPGVTLNMPFVTLVPESYKYVIAQANFFFEAGVEYTGRKTRLGAEKVFEVLAIRSEKQDHTERASIAA